MGLGKTIEAGVLLCQFWAERKRRLIVVCPAALRKQWAQELADKFNLPSVILDARSHGQMLRDGIAAPFAQAQGVVITSYNFAARMSEALYPIPFDLAVLDEAHKLRNVYKPGNVTGQRLKRALYNRRKVLLTATPIQNSLLELYGLATLIDDHIFGDIGSFRTQYLGTDPELETLKGRLSAFCQRTLRAQVQEYVRYTERRAVTVPFTASDAEHDLYEKVSAFLMRQSGFAIPCQQRQLTTLILRKLLASSSRAIAGTLEQIRRRLEDRRPTDDLVEILVETEEMEGDYLDEPPPSDSPLGLAEEPAPASQDVIDEAVVLTHEIAELEQFIALAHSIGEDAKARALLTALDTGFAAMTQMGAPRKALIFTESRRTQDYLKEFLDANGHAGRVVCFNGGNSDASSQATLNDWLARNKDTGRATGSRPVDMRSALVEHFRDSAEVMLATEAASEGVNLQFCALVINYDLPWNPQRVEQRIGRCHRYGQQYDVVVINFLNQRNAADRRVLELLDEKFKLFKGVFGASDEVLGTIESGVDFEKRILAIYQSCRSAQQIDDAFAALRAEMDDSIRQRLNATQLDLLANFDEDVRARLRLHIADALERNNRHFEVERARLEKWSEDCLYAAEKELADAKDQIKALNRQARQPGLSLAEQADLQSRIVGAEKTKRRLRQRIFDVEDEIMEQRDSLIQNLKQQASQSTEVTRLFTIRWSVV